MTTQHFIHLHTHSEYSILEGAIKIQKLIDLTADAGMKAVALTDNGTMYGSIDFYLKAKAKGIKAIIGCEVFVTESIQEKQRARKRLILLAKDFVGYQNLIKLVSVSYLEGFYYRPRVDWDLLRTYNKNVIAISPGLNGVIADFTVSHQDQAAKEAAQTLKEIYQHDFYLGLQKCGLPFEELATSGTLELANDLQIPLVATNNVYYATSNLAYTRDILNCIQTGRTLEGNEKNRSQSEQQYFKSSQEMATLFKHYPESISNTLKIADSCNVEIETNQVMLPHFSCPDQLSSEAYLEKLVWEGVDKKYPKRTQEIKDRVKRELDIILRMHYANYFLIIYDFLEFCQHQGIPVGPGRGSAAGSIVAYALDITKIDPLPYNLLFERFLNPERVSMPDIDIDFCIRRRGEVIDYIVQTYGQERVAQIVTFGTMQSRAVVRDVGRALGVPLNEVDFLAKCIPSTPGKYTSIQEALETIPELKKTYKANTQHKELLDISQVIEGQVRHTSTHAAGVVISRDPLTDVVPLIKNDGQISTQYPMADIENIGLLKMDILGLRNLTVMSDALVLIKENRGIEIELDQLAMDDEATYQLLCSGDTMGVFQLESQGMQRLVKDLKPKVFEDLIALLALYRPGPLGSGMVQEFISNKSGETQIKYEIPELEGILKPTYGMIVYQEQVMQIASIVGGFSLGQADMLRRAMGKKKKSVMDEMKVTFLEGAEAKNVPVKKAIKIFDLCYKFAEYGFNKSHSAAYALISYQTAYLKKHFPEEYMTALLSSVLGSGDKAALYVQNCRDLGITILGPSVNDSKAAFTIEANKEGKKAIRLGLAAIKNVGEAAIESIIKERRNRPYKDMMDFCMRVDLRQVNKRVLESLIKSSAMDSFGDRNKSLSRFEGILEQAQQRVKERDKGQVSLFAGENEEQDFMPTKINENPSVLSKLELLRAEKELVGLYVSGHPLTEYKDQLHAAKQQISEITADQDGQMMQVAGLISQYRKIITKRNQPMISAMIEDQSGQIPLLVFFKPGRESLMDTFQDERCMLVSGPLKVRGDECSIAVEQACILQDNQNKAMFINIDHLDKNVLKELSACCLKHHGSMPLWLQLNNQCLKTGKRYWINEDKKTEEVLEKLLGQGRIMLKSISE
ncbi:MAG: DNA polymerase III subunit alpha [bacterium]